jgi:hypothetical protein
MEPGNQCVLCGKRESVAVFFWVDWGLGVKDVWHCDEPECFERGKTEIHRRAARAYWKRFFPQDFA